MRGCHRRRGRHCESQSQEVKSRGETLGCVRFDLNSVDALNVNTGYINLVEEFFGVAEGLYS